MKTSQHSSSGCKPAGTTLLSFRAVVGPDEVEMEIAL
jgi:hypothetical protein